MASSWSKTKARRAERAGGLEEAGEGAEGEGGEVEEANGRWRRRRRRRREEGEGRLRRRRSSSDGRWYAMWGIGFWGLRQKPSPCFRESNYE